MKKILLATAFIIGLTTSALAGQTTLLNPFAAPSTLPLQAPPFDKIKDSDYKPAIEEGMKQQLAEINNIASNPEAPTFENTIMALEKSGLMLDRVNAVFSGVIQANTNETLDNIQTEMSPKLAAHEDEIYLNPKLFARIKAVYDQRDKLGLDPESSQVLQITYDEFVHAGANLNDTDKAKLRELNQQEASLATSFQQKLLAATKANQLVIKNKNDLQGLTAAEIAALSTGKNGKNKYVISLQNTTQQPLLSSLVNRKIREKLFNRSWNRTEQGNANDTRAIIATLASVRAKKAALLGFPDYASYTLYDQMATTPKTVDKFLGGLVPLTNANILAEANTIQTLINQKEPFTLKPWDWDFYSEKVRKLKYDLDQSQLKPYLELNNVIQKGIFFAANSLYGITFKERHDLPVYQPDVRIFDVFDQDGSQLGLIYFDLFQRDNKTGGAWMSNFVQQSKLLGTKPVVYVVTNFTKPAKGQPALLTFTDVTTLFHEFGHALHGLFSDVKYPASGEIARDFVEFPSQFNEHWALYPKVLKNYALHYKTNEPLQENMIEKIKQSATFNQGYLLGEILAAAELDMQWHELPANAKKQDVDAFEKQALSKTHADFMNVPPRYRSSYFLHIWANGYAAGYYAYLWTEMLDDDAFAWFKQHGGLTRENGQRYRDLILSRGHTMDYNVMFRSFYGNDPDIKPMLEQRGLLKDKQ